MVRVDEDDHVMRAERHRIDARIIDDMGEDRDVRFQVEDALQRLVGIAEQHADLDRRIAGEEARDHLCRVERADRGDAQLAGSQLAAARQQFLRLLAEAHDAAADLKQGRPGLRQLDPAPAPHQEFDAVALLQFLDLGRHRRLADVQRLGRRGEAAVLRHRVERTKVRENYSHSL